MKEVLSFIKYSQDEDRLEDDALWDAFNRIVEFGEAEKFIFVLGEWDFMFLLKV